MVDSVPEALYSHHGNERQHRLEQLESLIRSAGGQQLESWLNEYLDLGLELAAAAGARRLPALQESWLRRIYTHIRNTAICDHCNDGQRQRCLECLYQPYFALRHLYSGSRDGQMHLRRLSQDLSTVSRYLL
ncbi:hypothetical protein [Parathalassolituus penaei]|uniref:Uncharacterized protein n=1 Tax=Parathalassolituus penaei TaxID=2997323 RepID=A0A9X3IRH0_9GAMM|nr:hypothetical protein [Parathalassolituus penaei]MCY0964881.1 hypothetical protein [Parathalassolituus penaei]